MSHTPPFDLLTPPQREALICLACGDSVGRAAALAEVTERTVRRWRKLPAFQAALAEARVDFFSACRSHVNASIALAFEVLSAKAGSYSVHKGEQVKAATFLLGLAPNARMSAKSDRRNHKPHKTKHLHPKHPGHSRTSADMGGPERTPAATQRTPADAHGRPAGV